MRQPINAHSPPKLGGKATLSLGIHTHPRGILRSQPSFRSQNAPGHPCKIWKTSRVLLGSPSMATRISGRAHEYRHVRAHTHEHGCKRNVSCAHLLRGRAAARNWWYQARYVDARICVRECERMQVRASECVRMRMWVRVGEHDASRLVGARRTATKNPHPKGVRTAMAVERFSVS